MVVADSGNEARLFDVEHHQVLGPAMLTASIRERSSVNMEPCWQSLPPVDTRRHTQRARRGDGPRPDDLAGGQACALAGRNMTEDEWHRYLPDDGPRRQPVRSSRSTEVGS